MTAGSDSKFFKYKKYFSIVFLALVDTDYKFTYIDIGSYGSTADSAFFRNSHLCHQLYQLYIHADKP